MRFEPLAIFAGACAACAPAPLPEDAPAPAVELPDCTPNLDGRITKDELPFVVGAVARVRVGQDLAVDTDGDPGQGSARSWDLSRPDPKDQPRGELVLEPMEGQWFEERFPQAELAGPLQPGNRLFGALSVDDDGVWLFGSASSEEAPPEGRTLLVYDAPVPLYPFPLALDTHAESVRTVTNGSLYGIPVAFQDTTTVDVTAHGEVILPDLILEDALRVTVRLSRVPVAGVAVQQVTHIFLHECVGEVARIVSPAVPLTDELPNEFPIAAEVWRLSF